MILDIYMINLTLGQLRNGNSWNWKINAQGIQLHRK